MGGTEEAAAPGDGVAVGLSGREEAAQAAKGSKGSVVDMFAVDMF